MRPAPRTATLLFFGTLLVLGLTVFSDYGVTWDEPNMLNLGSEAFDYVFGEGEWPETTGRRFHGPIVEMTMHAVQKLLGTETSRATFLVRHAINFLLFYLGVVFFYLLCFRHFKNRWLALLGCTFLVLSPRIFSHAFYNSRDIPAMTFFIIAIFTLLWFLEQPTTKRAVVHAFTCALLITVRMTGILLPTLTILFLCIDTAKQYRRASTASSRKSIIDRAATSATVYLAAGAVFTYAFWPLLWEAPIANFLAAYSFMSSITGGGYYFGELRSNLPWHYLPVWIVITTPPLYTFLFLIGLLCYSRLVRTNAAEAREAQIILLWFLLPIVSVVVLGAGIYDGWRHLFFIYPAFLLIALEGVRRLMQIAPRALAVLITCALLATVVWMVRNHPLQNLYFSLPSRFIEGQFELDYWGLSYRTGFEKLLAAEKSDIVRIHVTSPSGAYTPFILEPHLQDRIRFTDAKDATYILDNFRHNNYEKIYPAEKEILDVEVDGIEVLSIYKMR